MTNSERAIILRYIGHARKLIEELEKSLGVEAAYPITIKLLESINAANRMVW